MIMFLLFLPIELQSSSSSVLKALESLFVLVLSFPLLVQIICSFFSSIIHFFTFALFFYQPPICFLENFLLGCFPFLKIAGPPTPATREEAGTHLPRVPALPTKAQAPLLCYNTS